MLMHKAILLNLIEDILGKNAQDPKEDYEWIHILQLFDLWKC